MLLYSLSAGSSVPPISILSFVFSLPVQASWNFEKLLFFQSFHSYERSLFFSSVFSLFFFPPFPLFQNICTRIASRTNAFVDLISIYCLLSVTYIWMYKVNVRSFRSRGSDLFLYQTMILSIQIWISVFFSWFNLLLSRQPMCVCVCFKMLDVLLAGLWNCILW